MLFQTKIALSVHPRRKISSSSSALQIACLTAVLAACGSREDPIVDPFAGQPPAIIELRDSGPIEFQPLQGDYCEETSFEGLNFVPSSTPDKHTVLILDDGFDTSIQTFDGKIVGQYTLECSGVDGTGLFYDPNEISLGRAKFEWQNFYAQPRRNCRLVEGIEFQSSDVLDDIMNIRDEWNLLVREKRVDFSNPSYQQLLRILNGEDAKVNYHGTQTASLLAYNNPDTDIVLVQLPLATSFETGDLSAFTAATEVVRPVTSSASVTSTQCFSQDKVDFWVASHSDPVVQRAFINQPFSGMERALQEAIDRHGVTMVNFSAGRAPRTILTDLQQKQGCGSLDLSNYFRTAGILSKERKSCEQRQLGKRGLRLPLTIQAAGNASTRIDSLGDTRDCSDRANNLIMIGSSNSIGQRSGFSNFGGCIDFYTLGEKVITSSPESFLNIVDGTSFSAPFVTRFLSQNAPVSSSADQLIEFLDQAGQPSNSKLLPLSIWPAELSYRNAGVSNLAFIELR